MDLIPWAKLFETTLQQRIGSGFEECPSRVSISTISLQVYAEIVWCCIRLSESRISSLYLSMEFKPDQLRDTRTRSILKQINTMGNRLQRKYNEKVVYRIHVCQNNEAVSDQFGTPKDPKPSAIEYKKLNSSIEWRCLNLLHLEFLKQDKKIDPRLVHVPLLHDYAVINRQALIGYNLQTERIVSLELGQNSVTAVEYLALFNNIVEFTDRDILWTWHKLGLNPHSKKYDSSHDYSADEKSTHTRRRHTEN